MSCQGSEGPILSVGDGSLSLTGGCLMTWTPVPRRIPLDLSQPCWPWPGSLELHGYARLMVDGQMKYAHRLAYQLHVGPIPKGWELDHVCHSDAVRRGACQASICRHRSCWNPAHLEAVPSRENSIRGGHPLFALARRGTCRAGHDLTNPENVRLRPDGRRRCKICSLAYNRFWRKRARAHD